VSKRAQEGAGKTRSYSVSVRLSTEEYQRIKELSEALGVSIGEIIRNKVFSGEFPRFRKERLEKICSEIPALVREVNRIGVNVNQIAKACNKGRVVDYAVLRQLEEISQQLASLLLLVVKSFEELGRADSPSTLQGER